MLRWIADVSAAIGLVVSCWAFYVILVSLEDAFLWSVPQ
jgi:hypothetical protein